MTQDIGEKIGEFFRTLDVGNSDRFPLSLVAGGIALYASILYVSGRSTYEQFREWRFERAVSKVSDEAERFLMDQAKVESPQNDQ